MMLLNCYNALDVTYGSWLLERALPTCATVAFEFDCPSFMAEENEGQRGNFAQGALAIYEWSDSKAQEVHFTTSEEEEK